MCFLVTTSLCQDWVICATAVHPESNPGSLGPAAAVVRPTPCHQKVTGQKLETLGCVMCHVEFVCGLVLCDVRCVVFKMCVWVSVWRKRRVGVCGDCQMAFNGTAGGER